MLQLEPDRVAVFGYAHLPERMAHQRLIRSEALPDAGERHAQASQIAAHLAANGYVRVGLDHFARATDQLAQGPVVRNFQGYATDRADALIGLGASAISHLPQGYVQNAVSVADYGRCIEGDGLATAKGVELTADDRVRGHVIERLMCDLAFSTTDLGRRFGALAEPVIREARALVRADADALVEPTTDGFVVTERGRPFIRSICACFDASLDQTHARYSLGV